MASILTRYRVAVRGAIETLAPTGFTAAQIVDGKTLSPRGIQNRKAIVVANARAQESRLPSPAGMRRRELLVVVAVNFMADGTGSPTEEEQETIVEALKAAFDLPATAPAAIVADVPEWEEIRVKSAESFIPQALRSAVDLHRFAVSCMVCQLAGVS